MMSADQELLEAVKQQNLAEVQRSIEAGAKTYQTDANFKDCISQAFELKNYALLALLLKARTRVDDKRLKQIIDFCYEFYNNSLSDKHYNKRLLCYAASHLLGFNIYDLIFLPKTKTTASQFFSLFATNQTERYYLPTVQTYWGHLSNLKGTVTAADKEEIDFENINPLAFLGLRILSFLEIIILLKTKLVSPPHGFTIQEVEALLCKELLCQVETFYLKFCCSIKETIPEENKAEINDSIVENLIFQLQNLQEAEEYSCLSGWEGHGIYINFTCDKNNLLVRIDNLGQGGNKKNSSGNYFHKSTCENPDENDIPCYFILTDKLANVPPQANQAAYIRCKNKQENMLVYRNGAHGEIITNKPEILQRFDEKIKPFKNKKLLQREELLTISFITHHTHSVNRVELYPCVLGQFSRSSLKQAKQYLSKIINCYDDNYAVGFEKIYSHCLPVLAFAPYRKFHFSGIQTAGNCAAANHSLGVLNRLCPKHDLQDKNNPHLFYWLIGEEIKLASQLVEIFPAREVIAEEKTKIKLETKNLFKACFFQARQFTTFLLASLKNYYAKKTSIRHLLAAVLKPDEKEFPVASHYFLPHLTVRQLKQVGGRIPHIEMLLNLLDARMLVYGATGAGKSTFCQYLVNILCQPQRSKKFSYVFWIWLRELNIENFPPGTYELIDLIKQLCFSEEDRQALPESAWLELTHTITKPSGAILWILDGADELHAPDYLQAAVSTLLKQTPCLLTSKTSLEFLNSELKNLTVDKIIEIAGFDNITIENYVRHFFTKMYHQPETIELLRGDLQKYSSLYHLCHVPLNLEIVCSLYKEGQRLGNIHLTDLYRKLAKLFMQRYFFPQTMGHSKTGIFKAGMEMYFDVLGQLAEAMLKQHQQSLPAAIELPAAKEMKPGHYQKLFNELLQAGLIKLTIHSKEYEFPHPTFQEFFAARQLVKTIAKNLQAEALHPEQKMQHLQSLLKKTDFMPQQELIWTFMLGFIDKQLPMISPAQGDYFYTLAAAQQQLHFFVPPKLRVTNAANAPAVSLEAAIGDFLQAEQQLILLLHGNAGAGKSLSLLSLVIDNDAVSLKSITADYLLVYIKLKRYQGNAIRTCVASAIEALYPDANLNWPSQTILLLLDGYDEIDWDDIPENQRNVYLLNGLQAWGKAKVIITYRSQALPNNYQQLFFTPDSAVNKVYHLLSFGEPEIQTYLEKYQQQFPQRITEVNTFRTYLHNNSAFAALLTTPLLLRISLEAWPTLQHELSASLPRFRLYDAYVTQWINRQSQTPLGKKAQNLIELAQRLALAMFRHNKLEITFLSETPEAILFNDFFSEPQLAGQLVLQSCPIRKIGAHRYDFTHKTFYEFFIAKTIADLYLVPGESAALSNVIADNPLNQFSPQLLWQRESAIIQFLAEQTKNNPDAQARWFRIVQYSRKAESKHPPLVNDKVTQNKIKAAAANAFTILNWAGVSFSQGSTLASGKDISDLSGVRIPGADASQGIFHHSDFAEANLKRLQAQQSFWRGANVSKAKLHNIAFGERAYWKLASEVNCMAFSPDGQMLALGVNDCIVLYAWPEGQVIQVLQEHTGSVTCLAWRQDGLLASGSRDNTIQLWEREATGHYQTREILLGHRDSVSCLAWHNGVLASGSHDETIRLWERNDTGHHQRRQTLRGHTNWVTCLAWHNGMLASGSGDNTIRLWKRDSAGQYQVRETLYREDTHWVTCLAWKNNVLASGSGDNTIRLWERDSAGQYQVRETLQGHTNSVPCLAWQDGLLASGSGDKTIRLWERDSAGQYQVRETLQGHTDWVSCLAWQNGVLTSGSRDKTIRLWEHDDIGLGHYQLHGKLQGHTHLVISLAWQNGVLASDSDDASIRLWKRDDTGSYQLRETLLGHGSIITCLVWQNDILASGSEDTTIRLWKRNNTGSYQLRETLRGHTHWINCLAWKNDLLVSGSRDKTIRLWKRDADSPYQLHQTLEKHNSWISCLALQDDMLASSSGDKKILLWERNADGGYKLHQTLQRHTDWVTSLAWQNAVLASGSGDQKIYLWTKNCNEPIRTLKGHRSRIIHLQWLEYIAYLLSWSDDGEVILWNTATGNIVQRYQLLPLTAVAYQPQGLMTGDAQGRICYWSVTGHDTLTQNPPRLPNWRLQWASGDLSLDVKDMNIQHARGLSNENKRLLQQRGAIGICTSCLNTHNIHSCQICQKPFCPQRGRYEPRYFSEQGCSVPGEYSRCNEHR